VIEDIANQHAGAEKTAKSEKLHLLFGKSFPLWRLDEIGGESQENKGDYPVGGKNVHDELSAIVLRSKSWSIGIDVSQQGKSVEQKLLPSAPGGGKRLRAGVISVRKMLNPKQIQQ